MYDLQILPLMRTVLSVTLSVTLFVTLLGGQPALQAVDYVHLNEIMYDTPLNEVITAPPYSNGEYIELYNAGKNAVDLTGWQVRGDGTTEVYEFASLTMPPHSFLILAYRHSRSPEFSLADLFPDTAGNEGQIVYQNKITLKNTKEYIRLYDSDHVLRDSVYYGNETSIKPISDRLIATNKDNISGMECVSVQRVHPRFHLNGTLVADHKDWEVATATPFSLSSSYDEFSFPQELTSYTYDAAGNRTSRTIVLQPVASRRNAGRSGKTVARPSEDASPLTDLMGEHEVRVYPNPTQGRLAVTLTGTAEKPVHIKILDMQGRLIEQKEYTPPMVEFDLTRQPAGYYVMAIRQGDETSTWTIIKR